MLNEVEVVILTAHLQSEGLSTPLKNLYDSNVKKIMLTTMIEEFCKPGEGTKFPSMATGFDRPVFGERVIYVKPYSSFEPNMNLYRNTKIKPLPKKVIKDYIGEAIKAAEDMDMKVDIIDAPTAVPTPSAKQERWGYPYPQPGLDEYKHVRVDGERIDGIEAKGCLNNPDVRNYALARIKDIISHYPDVDTLFLDHVEFPTYNIKDNFSCFCKYCYEKAKEMGYNLSEIKEAVYDFYKKIKNVSKQMLKNIKYYKSLFDTIDILINNPLLFDWIKFKTDSVIEFVKEARSIIKEENKNIALGLTGFTPSLGYLGSRNYRKLAEYCDTLMPKFYNEHWGLIVKWWTEELMEYNKNLTDEECIEAFYVLAGWSGLEAPKKINEIDPSSPKGIISPEALIIESIKIKDMVQEKSKIIPIVHCWGTKENLERKLSILKECPIDGVALFNYGLLSDEKLNILKEYLK